MQSPSPEHEVRFVAADPSHRLRIAVGSRLLIGLGSIVFWLLGVLGHRGPIHAAERTWARMVTRLLRIRLDIEGVDNFHPAQSYVVVSLHEGFADAVALMLLGLDLRFLVRDELFEWDALGRYLAATDQIQVDERPTRSALRAIYRGVQAAVAAGDSVAVFAQGSILGVEVAFQLGAFRMAKRFGLPVLPVVITGAHRVWEHPYSPIVRTDQRVSVRVLRPLDPNRLNPETIRDLERRMKILALDSTTAPARRFEPERDGWWDDYAYEIDPDYPELAERVSARRRARDEVRT